MHCENGQGYTPLRYFERIQDRFLKDIERSILEYQSNNFFGHMPHPSIITHLCIKGGVTFNKDEEEKCSAVCPLTLTTITKNPTSKGKENLKGVEEDKGEKEVKMNISEPRNQAPVIRKEQTRNEIEKSASLDWVVYLEVAAYQKDQAKSSSQQISNVELLEIMKRLEQGMLERDIQLKSQLEKKYQYFEEEIRKKNISFWMKQSSREI